MTGRQILEGLPSSTFNFKPFPWRILVPLDRQIQLRDEALYFNESKSRVKCMGPVLFWCGDL